MNSAVHTKNTMENTLARFENDTEAKWYVAQQGRLRGPISGKEIAYWITANGVSVGNYIWTSGQANWQRIYEIPDFAALLPSEPSAKLKAEASRLVMGASGEVKARLSTGSTGGGAGGTNRTWYVYTNSAQYGPFEPTEVEMMIDAGRVTNNSYLWKKGMPNWVGAATVTGFKIPLPEKSTATSAPESSVKEQRNAPRKPFEVKILMTDGKEVGWALCRDVSIGGMQVLMDHSPGQVGTVLKLNVSASDSIPAFTCEGTIVRILEDGRGFSFRFNNLPNDACQAIEQYVSMA